MDKEKNAVAYPIVRELFQLGIYKRSQGRIARQVTFGALVIVFLIGAWRLSEYAVGQSDFVRYYLPAILFGAGTWFAFRLVNLPTFADFLIQVEVEMNKVSWPSRHELIRSSLVVIFCIFFLAIVLFAYDVFWKVVLSMLNIVNQ